MSNDSTEARRGGGNGKVTEPREKRRTPLGYIVFSLFVTLLGVAVAAGLVALYGTQRLAEDGPLDETRTVSIARGMGTSQIADELASKGVISNRRIFLLAAVYESRTGNSLKAGEYQFEAGDSMREVLDKITSGKALVYKVTIPEGLTSQQVLARVSAAEALTGDPPAILPEGSVLPDTYVYTRGMTRARLVERMRTAQTELLDELWEKRIPGLPLKTREQALILASIVEKETGVPEERPEVAAVFLNRLLQGMRLQSDPTIIYGIVGGKGRLDRPIRRSEIDRKTPYNTYQIDGLPPTPIANPGREAIAAVLQPANTDALYFVADGTGGHVFSRTLAEHNANVARWRKIEAERRVAETNGESKQASDSANGDAAQPSPVDDDSATKGDEAAGSQADRQTGEQAGNDQAEPTGTVASANAAADPTAQEEPATEATESRADEAQADQMADPAAGSSATDDTAPGKVPLPRPKPAIE